MSYYLKIQEDVAVAGVTASPSYLLPLNEAQASKAKELVSMLDLVDNDGGAVDGDADLVSKFKAKLPIVGSVNGTTHLTLSVVER